MRKSFLLFALLPLAPIQANAQKNQIFAGYSAMLMEARPSGLTFINGWQGAYTYNISDFLGITADSSGDYGEVDSSRINFHTYLAGPEVRFVLPRHYTPFVQALFGESRESFQAIVTNKFSFSVGAGLDYEASKGVALRLIQLNFITGNFTQSSPESRLSTGIVFRF
jgi:hypothetical protein